MLGGERLDELVRVGFRAGLDRQLERLAAVAQLVGDLGAGILEPRAEALAQLGDRGGDAAPR